MTPTDPVLFWFRQDLRLTDNPGLLAAARRGPVIPVYVLDDVRPGRWRIGGAGRWWLAHSLGALARSLEAMGSRLVLRHGPAEDVIAALVAETGARAVAWNRCYEPFAIAGDQSIRARLQAGGIAVESFNAGLLFEPWEIQTGSGRPYSVFTPFWRALLARVPPGPTGAPERLDAPARWPRSDRLQDWALLPRHPDWAGGLRATWVPGEAAAWRRLQDFLQRRLAAYATARNRPELPGSSRLSPHLHWGEIGPRQVWHAARMHGAAERSGGEGDGAEAFLREIAWREFTHHLLYHHPDMPLSPLRPAFAHLKTEEDPVGLRAWQQGRTGYPIVDAGMRELWHTGWMHNRIRMITASFLVKDLLLPWQAGEAWFWDTLVDADLANNAAGWQWVVGSGADAAPFFRVFNPVLQGEKFDPDGAYVRRWVPELAALPDRFVHKPWEAPPDLLAGVGVALGRSYPVRILDHKHARRRALDAFAALQAEGG